MPTTQREEEKEEEEKYITTRFSSVEKATFSPVSESKRRRRRKGPRPHNVGTSFGREVFTLPTADDSCSEGRDAIREKKKKKKKKKRRREKGHAPTAKRPGHRKCYSKYTHEREIVAFTLYTFTSWSTSLLMNKTTRITRDKGTLDQIEPTIYIAGKRSDQIVFNVVITWEFLTPRLLLAQMQMSTAIFTEPKVSLCTFCLPPPISIKTSSLSWR